MGITTIEWTATIDPDGTVHPGYTFNPWLGCTKVSDGCKHCYAESLMDHRYGKVKWGPTGQRQRTSAANWRKPLQWNRQAEAQVSAGGRRPRVFCASLADVFEDNLQLVEWRDELFTMIEKTPYLDWLLLTKRPHRIMEDVPAAWRRWFPDNVWLGTSIENQEAADQRIPELLSVPAKVRFLSCEPLLGEVSLRRWAPPSAGWAPSPIHWVIVGAESGHGARPMNLDWARSLRDQCQAASVSFFFKQMLVNGKKVGLPELDGCQWAEFPEVVL